MNEEQDYIRSSLQDWDTVIVGGVRLPAVFDEVFAEVLDDVAGTTLVLTVATADVLGEEAVVSLTVGTTQVSVETVDGRELGPFIIEGIEQAESPGLSNLRLRRV